MSALWRKKLLFGDQREDYFPENPNNPFLTLKPHCPIFTIEYSPKDSNTLVSGLMSGQVAFWDIRRGSEPVEMSLIEESHRDPCDKVLWTNSKTGTEFFSASKDGQVFFRSWRRVLLAGAELDLE